MQKKKKRERSEKNKLTNTEETISLIAKGKKKKKVNPGPISTRTAGDTLKHSMIIRLGAYGMLPMLVF